jgi:L-amino acid N-acyltransferase YncA
MKIRKANKKDIEPIVQLNTKLGDYHTQLDAFYKTGREGMSGFRKHLKEIINKKNFRIIVAEDQKKIVGFFVGRINKAKPYAKPLKVGGLNTAFVCKECRRSGIGQIMFKDLIDWFRKNKIKNIELSVDFRNKIGCGAWKKFGFKNFMKKMRLDL